MHVRALAVTLTVLVAGVAMAPAAHAQPPSSGENAVIAWNEHAAGAVTVPGCLAPFDNPLHESRLYAVMHVAIHDALAAIDRRSRPYALATQRSFPGASPDAAVAAAARHTLVPLFEELPEPFAAGCAAGAAALETDYDAALDEIPAGTAKTQGVHLGTAAAAVILALRAGDGSDTCWRTRIIPQSTMPGVWRFTPGFDFAFMPGWGEVTPFVLDGSSQFRPGPPYDVTGRKYAADFNEVKRLGGDDIATPSARIPGADRDRPVLGGELPPAVESDRQDRRTRQRTRFWQSARFFGLLNVALADGYVATFDTKYHYDYWRPVTAIQAADTDGNPRTAGDADWTPLVPTPPVPDYDSGHSVQGGAASRSSSASSAPIA